MKRILILTYYWPPSGGAGVQRWLKFTKYLPEFDVEPIVLTVDPVYASYAQRDESLLQEISPDIKVFYTKSFEFYQFYTRFSKKKEIPYGGFSNEGKPSFFQKISRFVRGNFLLPDPRKGWNRYAYHQAENLIEEYQIDTVITTSPPHSTQLIGLKLKRKLGIRWIADFRDPWTDIYYYSEFHHTALAKMYDRLLEKKVIENADQLITVSKDLARLLDEKSKKNILSKTEVIPNGYDEDDFQYEKQVRDDRFIITYTGTVSEAYDFSGFIRALKSLDSEIQNRLLLRFVGNLPIVMVNNIQEQLPAIELEVIGYVDHKKSVGYLIQSDLLLLVIPKVKNNKGIVTGKFFEYLASGKPILAIGPTDGDLAEIMKETACGKIFLQNDSHAIVSFINQIYHEPLSVEPINAIKYSRRTLAENLASILIN